MSCDPYALALDGVLKLTPYQPGKPVSELERELGLTTVVKLASNENPLGPSPLALAAMQKTLSGIGEYPDGNGFALKSALGERYGLDTDQITLGNGSNDVLELLARAFLKPGLKAVFSEHAFAVYPLATIATGAECKPVSALPADADMPMGHDLDAMAAAITDDVRLVFVANPNNPTGTWVEKEPLRRFLEKVPSHCIAVLDEAYTEYVEDGRFESPKALLQDFPNLIVTRTFSKAWGLAGLRVGYGLSSPAIADLLNRVRQPFNVNSVALAAAEAALADNDHLLQSRTVNEAGLVQWKAACDKLGLAYLPSLGNFLAINVQQDGQALFDVLLRKGVITRTVGVYGMPEWLRVSIGTAEQNDFAIKALQEALTTH
ncbi:MAG: histidinol-phosphate transaminase [Gammaproteobacteria bacterium]|nr:histidinol-phosphate transaminase [Gammaproteobacteria bacterium]